MAEQRVYLDYAAGTPVLPEVKQAMGTLSAANMSYVT